VVRAFFLRTFIAVVITQLSPRPEVAGYRCKACTCGTAAGSYAPGVTKQLMVGATVLVLLIGGFAVAVVLTLQSSAKPAASGASTGESTPEAQVLAFIAEEEAWEKCELPPGRSLEEQLKAVQNDISDPNTPSNRLLAVVKKRFEVAPDASFFDAGSPPNHQAGAETITSNTTNGDQAVITTHLEKNDGIDYRYTLHRGQNGWLIISLEKSLTKAQAQPVNAGS
jgi:hypothetical protein